MLLIGVGWVDHNKAEITQGTERFTQEFQQTAATYIKDAEDIYR